jgi:hypothetical protein
MRLIPFWLSTAIAGAFKLTLTGGRPSPAAVRGIGQVVCRIAGSEIGGKNEIENSGFIEAEFGCVVAGEIGVPADRTEPGEIQAVVGGFQDGHRIGRIRAVGKPPWISQKNSARGIDEETRVFRRNGG